MKQNLILFGKSFLQLLLLSVFVSTFILTSYAQKSSPSKYNLSLENKGNGIVNIYQADKLTFKLNLENEKDVNTLLDIFKKAGIYDPLTDYLKKSFNKVNASISELTEMTKEVLENSKKGEKYNPQELRDKIEQLTKEKQELIEKLVRFEKDYPEETKIISQAKILLQSKRYDKFHGILNSYIATETKNAANSINKIANARFIQAKEYSSRYLFDSAYKKINQALVFEELPEYLYLLGNILFFQSKYSESEQTYSDLLTKYSDSLSLYKKEVLHKRLALIYTLTGIPFKKTVLHLQEALQVNIKRVGTPDKTTGLLYVDIGNTYSDYGLTEQAIENYENAYKIFEKVLPPNSIEFGLLYLNIGVILGRSGFQTLALNSYIKALPFYENTYGKWSPENIILYTNICQYYPILSDSGFYYLNKAENIAIKTYGLRSRGYANILSAKSIYYRRRKDFNKALENITKSTEIIQQLYGVNNKDLAQNLYFEGIIYIEMNLKDKAKELFARALKIIDSINIKKSPLRDSIETVLKKIQ